MSAIDGYSMFMLGILGTGHCIGMCGPLVIAFPARAGRFSTHLAYHAGRIFTYCLVGSIVGAIGGGLTALATKNGSQQLADIAVLQVGFSLLAAVFLLVFGLSRLQVIPEPVWFSSSSLMKVLRLHTPSPGDGSAAAMLHMTLIGAVLGFIPCGQSYAAFALALPSGSMAGGALILACFGLGTVPGLLLVGTGAARLFVRYRKYSELLSGLLMLVMAVFLAMKAMKVLFAS